MTGNQQFPQADFNYGGRSGSYRGRGGRGGRNRGRGGRGYGRSFVQCQICYKFGHDASYCYFRLTAPPQADGYGAYGGNYGGNGAPPNVWMQNFPRAPQLGFPPRPSFPSQFNMPKPPSPQAYLTGNESSNSNSFNAGWYPDSGATHHVTPDVHNLGDAVSLTDSDQIHIGNGQGLSISSVGSMSISSPVYPHINLKLNNLLHVPSITKNLVSVSKFAKDNNVFFEFHPNTCYVKSKRTPWR
jgi:histone deacetylase 1/2